MTRYTVRPAGCVAWRENIQTLDMAIHWRNQAQRFGLKNILIVDDNDNVVRDCGCPVEAFNGEHERSCRVVSEC